MNCAANRRSCPEPVAVLDPVSLCRNHSIEVALAIVPAVLGTVLANREQRTVPPTRTREPLQTIRLRRSERAALAELEASRTPLTRRTVAAVIRSAGGSCSNQRAAEIARHFRTLRSAA